jgi:hypothetical protein
MGGGGRRPASCECGCANWPKNGAGAATADRAGPGTDDGLEAGHVRQRTAVS